MTPFLLIWYAWLVLLSLTLVSLDLLLFAIPYLERFQAQHTLYSLPITLVIVFWMLYFGIRPLESGVKKAHGWVMQFWNREYKGHMGDRMHLLFLAVKGILCSFGIVLIFIGPVAIPLSVYLVVMNISAWILQIQW